MEPTRFSPRELQVPQGQVTFCLPLIHNSKEQRFFINHLLTNLSSSGNKTGLNKHEAIYSLSHLVLISINFTAKKKEEEENWLLVKFYLIITSLFQLKIHALCLPPSLESQDG